MGGGEGGVYVCVQVCVCVNVCVCVSVYVCVSVHVRMYAFECIYL